MSRIKGVKSSAALMVAMVALVAALCGGAVAGVTISKLNKKEKDQVKRISKKQARKLDKKIELLPGPKGDPGPSGATNVVIRKEQSDPGTTAGDTETATASCNEGERAVGGGLQSLSHLFYEDVKVVVSRPEPTDGIPTGWTATAFFDVTDGNAFIEVYVVCAAP